MASVKKNAYFMRKATVRTLSGISLGCAASILDTPIWYIM